MKIIPKSSANNGSANKHSKSTKKSKATRKMPEKAHKDSNSSDSQEVLPKQALPKHPPRKARDSELPPLQKMPDVVKSPVKKPPLEKRKQDGSEWKALKKIDYQRLETVLEEGQLSSEEASSKHNFLGSGRTDSESDTDRALADVAPVKSKKSWIYSLMSLSDHSDAPRPDEDPLRKPPKHHQRPLQKQQPDQLAKTLAASDRASVVEPAESHGEPTESLSRDLAQSKRSVILSGMMEILPIFSNDKFVCSRDAISIEEYEDPELERGGTGSGKTLLEAKAGKDSRAIDIKPFLSANCVKKERSFDGRFVEKVGDFKDMAERKLRYKVFTDRSVCQQTSSPFINSLLVLTPFSNERERLLNEQKLREGGGSGRSPLPGGFPSDLEEGKFRFSLRVFSCITMTALFLLTILLTIAWKSYHPPCFIDSVLKVLPFIRPRRSYLQLFLDKLARLLTSCVDGMYLTFSSSNRISEPAVL